MAIVVAGLGNPGARYAANRHNVGWMVLDRLADAASFAESPWQSSFAKLEIRGHTAVLLKPQTFMNLSGKAIAAAANELGVEASGVLVISDEVQLPVGKLKLSTGGSDGGHNGLASTIHELGTREFRRLRLGVGSGPPGLMAEHVLRDFAEHEHELLSPTLDLAADAIRYWLSMGGSAEAWANALSRFNDKRKQPLEIRLAAEREAQRKRLLAAKAEAQAEAEAAASQQQTSAAQEEAETPEPEDSKEENNQS